MSSTRVEGWSKLVEEVEHVKHVEEREGGVATEYVYWWSDGLQHNNSMNCTSAIMYKLKCTVVKQADIIARGGKSTFFPVKEYLWRCFFIFGIGILRCLEVKKKILAHTYVPTSYPIPSSLLVL